VGVGIVGYPLEHVMAKKKKVPAKAEPAGKTRLELRFDSDLAETMKSFADEAGISVNQMVQGIVRWAMSKAVVGEAYRDEFGGWRVKPADGCIFFGSLCQPWEHSQEALQYEDETGKPAAKYADKGNVFFALDFTERRVVREDV
jgi:hypothetical protein